MDKFSYAIQQIIIVEMASLFITGSDLELF